MDPTPKGSPQRYGWRVNLLAMLIVLATLLIGYGLTHPRELALPFDLDSGVVAAKRETGVSARSTGGAGRDAPATVRR